MDSNTENKNAPAIDGPDFLSHLRAAGDFDHQVRGDAQVQQDAAATAAGIPKDESGPGTSDNIADQATHKSIGSRSGMILNPSIIRSSFKTNQNHQRAVSWGRNQVNTLDESELSSVGASPQLRHDFLNDSQNNAGPFVEEAELNILRSLEQNSSPYMDMESPSYLRHVSEDAAHDFSLPEPKKSLSTRHLFGNRSRGSSMADEEIRPLVNLEQENRGALHRRQMTTEDRLEGLAGAMSAMNNGHWESRMLNIDGQQEDHRRREAEEDRIEMQQITEGNTLAENADRLLQQEDNFERKQKARSMWNLLLSNLPSLQEETVDESQTGSGSGGMSPENRMSDNDIEAQRKDPNIINVPPSRSNSGESSTGRSTSSNNKKRYSVAGAAVAGKASDKIKDDLEIWRSFFRPRQETIWKYIKYVLLYAIIPLVGTSSALFYLGENPLQDPEDGLKEDRPSIAWICLFVVRQIVTFSMALGMQGLIIDFLALGTRIILRLVGPILTLLIVQSKGWPCIFFWWGVLDFAMLFGPGRFAQHWLYYQNAIGLFNAQNPSGHIVEEPIYRIVLTIMVTVSALVAIKRFLVGIYLGRQTFNHFGEELAIVMNKMVLVSEVSALAKDIEKSRLSTAQKQSIFPKSSRSGVNFRELAQTISEEEDDGATVEEKSLYSSSPDPITGSFRSPEREKLLRLLGHWEEPENSYSTNQKEIGTISSVLKFRKALTLIQRRYPFSFAFGLAERREDCIDSAQRVYERLLMHTPDSNVVQFETLALTALNYDGQTLNERKVKDLVKVFRPDREGNLTFVDWMKSIDSVYKQFRLLTASIDNSSQIDRAFENIINVIFYIIVVVVIMSQMGFNPLSMFLSLSSIILAFAFAIGSASSKYFEGLLFILVRRPYNIGDMIHVSNIEVDTSFDGAPGWVVEHVTLFQTIATWLPTNEKCSFSNGSLANSRIINWARSKQAQFHLFYKVPIGAPYGKIVVLKNSIEEYMRARPREWLRFNGFRPNKIEIEKGYVEYVIVIQHRDAWQNIGQILDSKGNLASYILEVTQQLGLNYKAPALPVNLRQLKVAEDAEDEDEKRKNDTTQKAEDFRGIVDSFNIRLN